MGIFSFLTKKKGGPSSHGFNQMIGQSPSQLEPVRVITMDMDAYLASDEKAWLQYLSQALRTYRKPGVSLKQEHEQWLTARAQNRALATSVRAMQTSSN